MWDYLIVGIYVIAIFGVGFYFSREKKNAETYLLGGRSMPAWAVGIASMMTLFSSISIVQTPGEIFNHGMTLNLMGSYIGPFLSIPCYMLFARFYFRLQSFTPFEYLEYRYDKSVRGIVAFSSFYIRVVYIGMVLYTSSKIFSGAFGWPTIFSILLVAFVGVSLCFIGGSKAIIWTDVFQAIIVFGGLFGVVIMLCCKIQGGAWEAVATAWADGHGLPEFSEAEFYTISPYVRLLFWLLLWHMIAGVLLDACSNQVAVQLYLNCKNWKEGLKSQLYSIFSGLATTILLTFIGLALYTYYKQNPCEELMGPIRQGDKALFIFIKNFIPTPLLGLLMAAMLSAIMSTVSGVTNSMSGLWVREFHRKFINKNMSSEQEYHVLRKTTVVLGIVATLFAIGLDISGKWLQQSVSEVATLFYFLSAAILPAYLYAVLSKRANAPLIWAVTIFATGETIAWNVWYALSRSSLQAWQVDPSVGFGWAGKLPGIYVWPWFVCGAILLLPLLKKALRKKIWVTVVAAIGIGAIGVGCGMAIWYGFSHLLINEVPRARSFAFTLPIPLFLGFIILRFCPIQPREKWQGLVVGSLHDEILVQKKD